MRIRWTTTAAALLVAGAACLGQNWELNGLAGGGAYRNLDLANRHGRATVGLTPGALFGASLVQHYYRLVSGEIRWTFQRSDLKVAAEGATEKFRASAHAIHYDWLVHARPREAWVRPFLATGAGFRQFRGTGVERAWQPLSQFAVLTRTREWKPLLSLGGGVRVRLSESLGLTAEVRDYLTPLPSQVIAPMGGASVSGWLHDFVPSLAVGLRF